MRYNNNKILLKPPKKKQPKLIKVAFVGIAILFALWWFYYFIENNDLVNQPFFPSAFGLNLHQSIEWISAIIVGLLVTLAFISVCYPWILTYRYQKITQFCLAIFLGASTICFGLFFGWVTRNIVYVSLNSISSQLALHLGTVKSYPATLSESHTMNPSFGQIIEVKRGKVMAKIIDPVSYRLDLILHINGKSHNLDPYCYSGSQHEPHLIVTKFEVSGQQSILGFRCTSGCELYRYFNVANSIDVTAKNFSQCRKIYIKQPSLK